MSATVLLCDADGCLFPSEEPAFEASADVTNRLLAELGIDVRFEADELRRVALGKNFRLTAIDLSAEHGVVIPDGVLDEWVREEQRAVTEHLGRVLQPDPRVTEPLERLAARCMLSVVSSSALRRLAACFTATGMDDLFPVARRYSAEDSLPVPTSKPDPAVYLFAGAELGATPETGVAIEDSVTGTRSAVAAGFPTVGNLLFVPADERAARAEALRAAGAVALIDDWSELEGLLDAGLRPPAPVPGG